MKKENRELLDLFEEHVMNSISFAHAQPVVIMPQALKLFIDIINEQDQRITAIENLMVNQALTHLENTIKASWEDANKLDSLAEKHGLQTC